MLPFTHESCPGKQSYQHSFTNVLISNSKPESKFPKTFVCIIFFLSFSLFHEIWFFKNVRYWGSEGEPWYKKREHCSHDVSSDWCKLTPALDNNCDGEKRKKNNSTKSKKKHGLSNLTQCDSEQASLSSVSAPRSLSLNRITDTGLVIVKTGVTQCWL